MRRAGGSGRPEAVVDEIFVNAKRKVVGLVQLVQPGQFVLLQIRAQGGSGHGQVVVRNLGEEDVVNHMAIRDVVRELVNAEAKLAVL